MHHRFKAMSVGIPNERRVVARVVVLADARRSFVHAAGAQARRVEAIDRFAIGRGEGYVKAGARGPRVMAMLDDREGGFAGESRRAVAGGARGAPEPDVAERRERRVVECGCAIEVLNAQGEVVEQGASVNGARG